MSFIDSDSGPVVINESKDILMNCWRTELNAPEILPYKGSLVEEMQQLLSHQEVGQRLNILPVLQFKHVCLACRLQLRLRNTFPSVLSDVTQSRNFY